MLSVATKAGAVKSGDFAVKEAISKGWAKLVILAEDASEQTLGSYKKLVKNDYPTIIIYGDKISLGNAVGKEFRAAVAVCDEGLAKAVRELTEVDEWRK